MRNEKFSSGPFDYRYSPPVSSIHCGTIKGGEALNIVPKHCSFEFEWRCIAKEDQGELVHRVKDFCANLEQEMKLVNNSTSIHMEDTGTKPALDTSEDEEVVKFSLQAVGAQSVKQVSYLTEASLFQTIGIPAVVIGPGSIEQAHKPNEYVEIKQMELCEKFVEQILFLAEGKISV